MNKMLLLLLLIIPLIVVAVQALFYRSNLQIYRRLSIVGISLPLIPLLYLIYEAVQDGNLSKYNIQFNSNVSIFSLNYGIDSASLWLTTITTIVLLVTVLLAVYIKKRQKLLYSLVILLQGSMLHVYLSRDALLLCASLLLTSFITIFLLGIWGEQDGTKTARRFAYRMLAGIFCITISCVLLLNISSDYLHSSTVLLGEQPLLDLEQYIMQESGLERQLAFVMMLLGLLCLLPIIGLHRLFIDIYRYSHLLITTIYSVTIGTIGVYIGYRLGLTYFADLMQAASKPMLWLMTVQWLFSCVSLWHQKNIRGWFAYSIWGQYSLLVMLLLADSELGLSMLWLHIISFQLMLGLLGGIFAALQERTKSLSFEGLRGHLKQVPFLTGLFIVSLLGWLGLPGMSHFLGTYHAVLFSFPVNRLMTICIVLGFISSLAFVVRMLVKVQQDSIDLQAEPITELRFIEAFPIILSLAFVIVIGCYPIVIVDLLESEFHHLYTFWAQLNPKSSLAGWNVFTLFSFSSDVWNYPVILSVMMSLAIWLVNHKQKHFNRVLLWQAIYHLLTLLVVICSAHALSVSVNAERILLISLWYIVVFIGYYTTIRAVTSERDATISSIQGLYYRQPRHAFILLLFNLALMSAPLTGGFIFQLSIIELWNAEGQYGLIMLWLVAHVLMATIPLEVIIQMYMTEANSGKVSAMELPKGLKDQNGKLRMIVLISYLSLLVALGLTFWI